MPTAIAIAQEIPGLPIIFFIELGVIFYSTFVKIELDGVGWCANVSSVSNVTQPFAILGSQTSLFYSWQRSFTQMCQVQGQKLDTLTKVTRRLFICEVCRRGLENGKTSCNGDWFNQKQRMIAKSRLQRCWNIGPSKRGQGRSWDDSTALWPCGSDESTQWCVGTKKVGLDGDKKTSWQRSKARQALSLVCGGTKEQSANVAQEMYLSNWVNTFSK